MGLYSNTGVYLNVTRRDIDNMQVTDYCCLARRIESVEYYCIWDVILDFLQIFVIVKIISWTLERSRPAAMIKSPQLKPRTLYHDMFLRKRLMAINWKLIANKARAMYYMKLACFRRRLIIHTNPPTKQLRRTMEDMVRCRSSEDKSA